jgi:SAM-dependent methyltransferase
VVNIFFEPASVNIPAKGSKGQMMLETNCRNKADRLAELMEILRCPRCRDVLRQVSLEGGDHLFCTNATCIYFSEAFFEVSGKPVLVDFPNSILKKETFLNRQGSSPIPRDAKEFSFKRSVGLLVTGSNKAARHYCNEFLGILKGRLRSPRVLVIGGGTIGRGAEALYSDNTIRLVGTDIYASRYVEVIADAHHLPFADQSFHGVWIQTVLEHVLEPATVVAEIHRILVPDGLVFADTPFMQGGHEGAYDFTRFTLSGHRWLFRDFNLIAAGTSSGAGTALGWSMRYLARALTNSELFSKLVALLFFWTRFLDGLTWRRANADAAGGVYFFGSKCNTRISPADIVTYYSNL